MISQVGSRHAMLELAEKFPSGATRKIPVANNDAVGVEFLLTIRVV